MTEVAYTVYFRSRKMSLGKRLFYAFGLLVSVIVSGGIGYRLVEGWPWVDSAYMSVITVTTVGFSEVHPLSSEGRLFTVVLILLGVGSIAYTFGTLTDYIVAGELQGFLEVRRMNRQISSQNNHFIICGYGRMGREVCLELKRQDYPVVVIDESEESIKQAREDGYLCVQGNPGLDETLKNGGIERAAGLVAVSDDDAKNLLVVLTASGLDPALSIVARVSEDKLTDQFIRAGAHNVFSPYKTGGRRLAQILAQPEVIGFLDVILHDASLGLLLEHFSVAERSELDQRSIGEAQIRQRTGATVVGLKRPDSGIVPLELSTQLKAGDGIIALGTRQQLEKLQHIATVAQ